MEKEECSICFFQYDKLNKVPRILRCGHTFCQTCLEELKIPHKHCIPCPNCRVLTENVICTKNLPENDSVFNQQPMFGVNLNSPYEAAKRLSRECQSLNNTGDKYLKYLKKMDEMNANSEQQVLHNYEQEFEKVENVSKMLIKMINDYKEKLQNKLTDNMVQQRNMINSHSKEIEHQKCEVVDILENVSDVEGQLESIKENEQTFLKQ